ncbi:MAG: hypothetical protein K2O88_03910 [Paramuribaculum sp.]|nr:hypothetical protein [Paramuribaculum sp.]
MAIKFIKKLVLSAVVFGGISFSANAAKPNVYIDYFRHAEDIDKNWVESVRSNVIEGIHVLNRVNLIDVDSSDALKVEADRRNQSNADAGGDMDRMAVMIQQGANYLIDGNVASIDVLKKKTDDGSIYYTAKINFTLKVINPNDGTLVGSHNYILGNAIISPTGNTPDDVVLKVAQLAKKDVRKFIEESFKLEGSVLEISEEKKDEAKMLYISIGAADGVAKDAEFEVCVSREVAGRKSNKVIGLVKVKDVEGDDISLCEVKKGGKEILAASKAGQTLNIKSKPKGGGLNFKF